MDPTQMRLTIPDSVDLIKLMGPSDSLLRRLESKTNAILTVRGNQVCVSGSVEDVGAITSVLSRLIHMVEQGDTPAVADIDLLFLRLILLTTISCLPIEGGVFVQKQLARRRIQIRSAPIQLPLA